jgi:hypothetical protein
MRHSKNLGQTQYSTTQLSNGPLSKKKGTSINQNQSGILLTKLNILSKKHSKFHLIYILSIYNNTCYVLFWKKKDTQPKQQKKNTTKFLNTQ